ncbi:MAG: hypothetical protein WCI57_04950 [Candidatus Berkelbacteria bacterium]
MGYDTYYMLFVDKDEDIHSEQISEKYNEGCGMFDGLNRWHSIEEDMREYSKLYPDTLFQIHGDGDENGDLWDRYFKNGKMQVCYAEIPPYDETKLT